MVNDVPLLNFIGVDKQLSSYNQTNNENITSQNHGEGMFQMKVKKVDVKHDQTTSLRLEQIESHLGAMDLNL
jgi:hypothetical protein